jgi:hypothetical protein
MLAARVKRLFSPLPIIVVGIAAVLLGSSYVLYRTRTPRATCDPAYGNALWKYPRDLRTLASMSGGITTGRLRVADRSVTSPTDSGLVLTVDRVLKGRGLTPGQSIRLCQVSDLPHLRIDQEMYVLAYLAGYDEAASVWVTASGGAVVVPASADGKFDLSNFSDRPAVFDKDLIDIPF